MVTIELDIVGLGAQGDGIADTGSGAQYIAFALPNERVRISDDGLPEVVGNASADRTTPLCRHFGTCGGCVAQHMSDQLYAGWKRDIVIEAFHQHGLDPECAPLRRIAAGSRRRAVLSARRESGHPVTLGYHRRKSDQLFDMHECPVLTPTITAQLAALRAIATAIPGRETRVTVLSTQGGLDISADHDGSRLGPAAIAELGRIAAKHRFARIAINGETVIERTTPALAFGGVDGVPPPGAFVQAVEAAEVEISQLVLGAVGKAKRVADLFCGLGAFTFPLARNSRVLAVDGDEMALASLASAARRAQGLKPIETKLRDLFHDPLSARELEGLDAVVFDPPRAGAKKQAERLAQSKVPLVIAISCDPGTLARDARILVDGGYHIEGVTPVDQFLFSARVEAVAVLRRRR